MNKNTKSTYQLILLPVAMTGAILLLYGINHGFGQTPQSSTPITDYVNSENQKHNSNSTDPFSYDPLVVVEYESPHTLIFKTKELHLDDAGRTIDLAKQNGFSVDSITAITESSQIGNSLYFDHWYNIFMSKK